MAPHARADPRAACRPTRATCAILSRSVSAASAWIRQRTPGAAARRRKASSLKVAYATHEPPPSPREGGEGGERNGHDFHDRGAWTNHDRLPGYRRPCKVSRPGHAPRHGRSGQPTESAGRRRAHARRNRPVRAVRARHRSVQQAAEFDRRQGCGCRCPLKISPVDNLQRPGLAHMAFRQGAGIDMSGQQRSSRSSASRASLGIVCNGWLARKSRSDPRPGLGGWIGKSCSCDNGARHRLDARSRSRAPRAVRMRIPW